MIMRDFVYVNTNILNNKGFVDNFLNQKLLSKLFLMGLAFWRSSPALFAETQKQPVDYVDPWIESAQSRYFYFNSAFLSHSVLMRQLRQGRARAWARERLTTIGQACKKQGRNVFDFIQESVRAHWSNKKYPSLIGE